MAGGPIGVVKASASLLSGSLAVVKLRFDSSGASCLSHLYEMPTIRPDGFAERKRVHEGGAMSA